MIDVTSENFQSEVLDSNIPVLCDFWATWCAPCRAITPILQDLSNSANGRYKIVKADVDTCEDLAGNYNVSSIPTLLLFKNGQVVQRLVGLQAKAKIEEALKQASES